MKHTIAKAIFNLEICREKAVWLTLAGCHDVLRNRPTLLQCYKRGLMLIELD